MASHVFVVDSSFKRTQVKVTPGKNLREVLEEACRTWKLDPDKYTLKTQNSKTVDLSQPFRLSGLSGGAKLQLTQASRSAGVVSVALQLPESEGGARLSDKFPSSTSLWLILRKYEEGVAGSQATKLNLTERSVPTSGDGQGRLVYEQPCLNVLGRTLETFTDLQKTLAQLGLNAGTAMMRLNFKSTERPMEMAMQEISAYFAAMQPVEADVAGESAQGAHASETMQSRPDVPTDGADDGPPAAHPTSDTPMPDEPPTQQLAEDETPPPAQAKENTPPTPQPTETPPPTTINGMHIYRPPSSSTPAATLQPDDPSEFEPTVDHAKTHQAALNRNSKNKRLLSDKELAEQETARQQALSAVSSVTVRVRYPDQSQIETTISKDDTAASLYAKVMDTLDQGLEPFELRYIGSRAHETLPNSSEKKLVRDFGFRGKVLVTLVWSKEASPAARSGPSLKEEYRRHATDLKVELASQQASGTEAHESAMKKPETGKSGEGSGSGSGKGVNWKEKEAKMKKLMGFGRK